jgi:hypothetical protein
LLLKGVGVIVAADDKKQAGTGKDQYLEVRGMGERKGRLSLQVLQRRRIRRRVSIRWRTVGPGLSFARPVFFILMMLIEPSVCPEFRDA